jgi:hypothetical protein
MLFAKKAFLELLALGQEDYHFGTDGHTSWVVQFRATDLTAFARSLGFVDLHDALHQAHAAANEKNILTG